MRPQRPYPLIVALFSLGYLTYFLSKGIFVVIALPCLLLLLPFPNAKRRFLIAVTQLYLRLLTRWYLPLLGGYDIKEISGAPPTPPRQPVLYVANHRGRMDALLVLSLLPGVGVVLKAYHERQTLFALLIRHFDFISVHPGRLSSVAAALDRCRALLAAGRSLLFFPEGSRAPSGRLQPFKNTAFQLACDLRLPVVPVIVHSTLPFMAKVPGSLFPRGHNEFRIRFLDPESPLPDDTPHTLNDRVHRRMARELAQLDIGTVWHIPRPNPQTTPQAPAGHPD